MFIGDRKNFKMMPAICPQCGGQVEVDPVRETSFCTYCGMKFIVEKAINTYYVQHATIEHVDTVNIVQKSVVESVFSFVNDQQKRIDEKKNEEVRREIEEERREREEERREREETRKKIEAVVIFFMKTYKKYWWAYLSVLLIFFGLVALIFYTESKNTDIHIKYASSELEGENYTDVVKKLQKNGFINVKTETIEDLILGWLTKDGEVEDVSIDGDTTFSTDNRFPTDVEIVVRYHTFPADKEKEATESPTPESTVESKPAENAQSTEETQSSALEEIITIDNNAEFAAVLNEKDPGAQIIKEFAVKYAGRTIEFDGNIAHMMQHSDYNTRFDFVIYPWDYSVTYVIGPSFKFENYNYYDLHLIGDNVPDEVKMGENLHFVAKIIHFNETSNLFYLEPISTKVR